MKQEEFIEIIFNACQKQEKGKQEMSSFSTWERIRKYVRSVKKYGGEHCFGMNNDGFLRIKKDHIGDIHFFKLLNGTGEKELIAIYCISK